MITGTDNEDLLFEARFIDPRTEPYGLFWCKDAEDMQAVSVNAVCKALTVSWKELAKWSEFICQYPYILVTVPPGPARDEIARELQTRFPLPVLIPGQDAFHGCASVLELRDNYGLQAIDKLVLDAEELPSPGLLNVAEIDCDGDSNVKRTSSGLTLLDREIGRFAPGELSVWTGRRGKENLPCLGSCFWMLSTRSIKCAYTWESCPQRSSSALSANRLRDISM